MNDKNVLKKTVLYNLAVVFLYTSTGLLGLMLAVPPGYATPIWAPSGIALGSVLVWGLRTLPGIFIASLLLNTYITFNNSGNVFELLNLFIGLIIGSGALLQAWFGWWLVKYFVRLDNPLHLPKDILVFAFLTGPFSCVIAATIGNLGLGLLGILSPEHFLLSWVTWWIGDSIGVLIFTPVFLISFAKPRKLWHCRRIPILLPLCLTFLIVVVAHIFYSHAESKRLQSKFTECLYFSDSERNKTPTLSPYFIPSAYSWDVWFALTATLFFCVLMNIILFILYGQRYLIQYLAHAKNMQLKTEKAENLLLLNAAAEGILRIDLNYTITFINPAAEQLLGYSSHELKNESITKILNEQITTLSSDSIENSSFYKAIEGKTIIKAKEAVFWKKDHNYFGVEYTCIPIIINNNLTGAAIIFSDITERLENEKKLIKMAHFDPLTKLPNRLSFFDYLEHTIARALRNHSQLGICFIDIDNFKIINDTFGHVCGDKLLMALPGIITPHLREMDYFARIGGDEFGLIIEEIHQDDDLIKIFERILAEFHDPIKIDDHIIKTSISIGIAMFPKNGSDVQTLFMNADTAMYHAKAKGKSTFSFFN